MRTAISLRAPPTIRRGRREWYVAELVRPDAATGHPNRYNRR